MTPAAHLAAPGRQADRLPTTIGDEAVELFAERALLWTRMRTLFVADVHLGKAAAFRAGGVPVPRGSTAADLARLAALVDASGAQRLVVHVQAQQPEPAGAFIGIEAGGINLHSLEELPKLVDKDNQRPKQQWWMDVRAIAKLMSQPMPSWQMTNEQ